MNENCREEYIMHRKWLAMLTVALLAVVMFVPVDVARASKYYGPCPYCGLNTSFCFYIDLGNGWHFLDSGYVHTPDCGRPADGYKTCTKSSNVNETLATCTTGGTITWHCDVCDGNFTEITSAPLGHSFTNYVSDGNATCTSDDTKTAVCDRTGCGVTETIADPGSALGHSFTSYVSDGNGKRITFPRSEQSRLAPRFASEANPTS
jgi:hypothetical protein